MKSVID